MKCDHIKWLIILTSDNIKRLSLSLWPPGQTCSKINFRFYSTRIQLKTRRRDLTLNWSEKSGPGKDSQWLKRITRFQLFYCKKLTRFYGLKNFSDNRKQDSFLEWRRCWKPHQMGYIEQRLFDKLESIHQSCGEVCNTRLSGPPGKVINQRGGSYGRFKDCLRI